MAHKIVLFDDRACDVRCDLRMVNLGETSKKIAVCRESRLLFDLQVFRRPCGSWLLRPGGYFVEEGEAVLITPMDSLFLALPVVESALDTVFQPRRILLSEGLTAAEGIDVMSRYLSEKWTERLRVQCCSFSDDIDEISAKALNYNHQVETSLTANPSKPSSTKKPRQSANQSKLAKADKTGMRNVSSYFTKR